MPYLKKYKISPSSKWLILIVLVVCAVAYIMCTYYINLDEIGNETINVAKIQTAKDVLLVIISMTASNLLLGIIVEVKSKNSIVSEIILNDVFSSPDFYKNMDEEKKKNMYNALQNELYYRNDVKNSIISEITEKIVVFLKDYYYESCGYVITCSIYDDYIEKDITKKVVLKSYDKSYTIKDFCIGSCSSKKIIGMDSYEIVSFEIDGKKIELSGNVVIKDAEMSNLGEQNEYDINKKFIYKKLIRVKKDKGTTIVVKCKTRTTIDDKSSTFRVVKPCKNFSLVYSIKQHDKFRLGVDAFGFLDDADESANNTSDSNINITFNDWIFEYDGVVVTILDKINND